MTQEILDEYYQSDSRVHLTGYTSTSTEFKCALNFALKGLKNYNTSVISQSTPETSSAPTPSQDNSYLIPVVLEIYFLASEGLFQLTSEYTAYPGEDEVLIQDGLEYLVLENVEMETLMHEQKVKFRLIRLKYPADNA